MLDSRLPALRLDERKAHKVQRLSGKVAMITGGGTGIGRACAMAFAKEGAKVILAGRRKDVVESASREINSSGGEAFAVTCEFTDPVSVDRALEASSKQFARLNTIVNNAGAVAVATAEETADCILLKVDALLGKGDREEAKRAMRGLPEEPFENPSYTFMVGRAYYELGEPARARPYVEDAARRDPENPDALYYLGLIREDEGDSRGALEAFADAQMPKGALSGRQTLVDDFAVQTVDEAISLADGAVGPIRAPAGCEEPAGLRHRGALRLNLRSGPVQCRGDR